MCLIALFFRIVDDAPLVIGANREEEYARGGEPPQVWNGSACRIVAGRDPVAGGTWFGVNEHGLVAAVTNRRRSQLPNQPRSRGLLTRELLDCPSVREATTVAVRELESGRYAGCNLLLADREHVTVLHHGEWLRVNPLPVGVHVLTSAGDVNSTADARIAHALEWLYRRQYATSTDCLAALRQLCSSTEPPPMCLRGATRGTVSSTLLALTPSLSRATLLHAQGPPDQTAYEDHSSLLRATTPDS